MSYSVNWITQLVSIPDTDLTLVSGTHYRLNMFTFLIEIRRLEANDGLWAPQIVEHTNPKINFAGADYAGFDKIINGYKIIFTGNLTRVDLIGSNNNIADIFISNGVSVVPSNSAGLQKVSIGSGVTPQDVIDIAVKSRDVLLSTENYP